MNANPCQIAPDVSRIYTECIETLDKVQPGSFDAFWYIGRLEKLLLVPSGEAKARRVVNLLSKKLHDSVMELADFAATVHLMGLSRQGSAMLNRATKTAKTSVEFAAVARAWDAICFGDNIDQVKKNLVRAIRSAENGEDWEAIATSCRVMYE